MKKCFFSYPIFILQLFSLIGFSSCSNDADGDTPYPLTSITGEWLADYSDESKVNFVNMTFSPDGRFTDWEVNIGLNNDYDLLVEGTYKYDGTIKVLTRSNYDPRQFYQEWRVNNVSKYTLDYTDVQFKDRIILHRVVDTYNMNLGDTRQWSANDAGFNAVSFFSCDERIASVNEDGMIHANKRGTVFVRGVSENDEAVIKVVVDDSSTLIDDFAKYIGRGFDNLIKDYGDPILQEEYKGGGVIMTYSLFDDILKGFAATYVAKNHVNGISAMFRDRADIQAIIDFFDARYEPLPVTEDYYHRYLIEQDGNRVQVMIDEKDRDIFYQWIPNEYEEYDGLVTASIDDVAKFFDFDLTEAMGIYYDIIDNPVYSSILISFNEDTREIGIIQLSCRPGVTESDVRDWLDEHYNFYKTISDYSYYISGNTFIRSEYKIGVTTNSNTGRVSVSYMNNIY